MAMQYVNYIKAKAHTLEFSKSQAPVLTDEDEAFLTRVTTSAPGTDIPVPETQERDAQIALMDGAQNIALPESPDEFPKRLPDNETAAKSNPKPEEKMVKATKGRPWNWIKGVSGDKKSKVWE
jgi:hypothetical protein